MFLGGGGLRRTADGRCKSTSYARAMALLNRVKLSSFKLKQAGRGDTLTAFRKSVCVCFDKITVDDENANDELVRACAGVQGAYEAFAAGKCTKKDAEAIAGLYKAGLKDGVAPLDALKEFVDAIAVVVAVRADRAANDKVLTTHGGLFFENGKYVFRKGAEVLARRKATNEHYLKTKEPGYKPANAETATSEGQLRMTLAKADYKAERHRDERKRVKRALRRADVTEPPNCHGIIDGEGKLAFIANSEIFSKVRLHVAPDLPEPNLPTSRAEAAERAERYRHILGRQTRAEFEGGWSVYSGDTLGHAGAWHAYVNWPRGQKKKRRPLIDPKSGEEWFDIKQDAIDLEEAWYEAECPPDWIKPKKPKKRRCN